MTLNFERTVVKNPVVCAPDANYRASLGYPVERSSGYNRCPDGGHGCSVATLLRLGIFVASREVISCARVLAGELPRELIGGVEPATEAGEAETGA